MLQHAHFIVDAAITRAHEHYGAYCEALSLKESVNGAHSKDNPVEQGFAEEARDMQVYDSIRDVKVIKEGEVLVIEDGVLTNVEFGRGSEIEQEAREATGLPRRALHAHPDGYKQDGDDEKDHMFGKVYPRVHEEKPKPGGVSHIRPLPKKPVEEDAEEADVHFAFKRNHVKSRVSSNLTQAKIEQTLRFTRRLTRDESDEEEVNRLGPTDPLQLFKVNK
jgi:hypothetical protein